MGGARTRAWRGNLSGFKTFLLRGNVIDLAVAVIIGVAFGAVVQALVKDLITPIIGAFGGLPDFSARTFAINGSKFLIGDFINAVIAFVVIAAVVYNFVVMPVEKMMERFKRKPAVEPDTMRDCPFCLSRIPKAATRCAHCTAQVAVEAA